MVLASLFRGQRGAPIFAERIGGWRNARLVTRCAFFVLGTVAASMTASIFGMLHIEPPYLIPGVLLVAAAEWLIVQRRLAFAGVEEALELAGLSLIAIWVFSHVDPSQETLGSLLVVIAFGIAGLRLLNPLFTTAAAAALSVALLLALERPEANNQVWAGLFCYALAWLALGLGAMRFKRPSYDRMLCWLVIAMPPAGYLWLASAQGFEAIDYLHNHSFRVLLAALMPLVLGLAALATGLRRRSHGPLVAFMGCIACVAFELRRLTGLSFEARLMVWGSALLTGALIIERLLRKPRAGITSRKLGDGQETLGLLELAGAGAIAAQGHSESARGVRTGGGGFGGGGASGEY